MVLFKGKKLNPEFKDNLPAGTTVSMTSKGSMNAATFIKFLDNFATYKPADRCLLIIYGAKYHIDLSIVLKVEKVNVALFCLPSNTTHELQSHWTNLALDHLE